MGAGGQSNIVSIRLRGGERNEGDEVLRRAPYSKPPFTLGQLKKAIPPHCFQRSLFKSFAYLVYDLTLAYIFYFTAAFIIPTLVYPFPLLAWPIYWVLQGCIFTGVWIIAHECGHHAFSDYPIIDDFVGLILHSFLFIPYFSWKYSHRRHHSNTGSLERDEAFVPKPKSKVPWYSKYLNNTPGRLGTLIIMIILGWPIYLLFNAAGRPYDRFACHYDPFGPIFSKRERAQVFISDLGILGMVILLYRVAIAKGLSWLISMYGIPLLIVNGFLVTITYLQHTHPALPHYNSTEWEWLKGALSTIDRDYGVLNKVFHNITDTHVAHHLFSTIPHYHAMEATKAIKPILGEYYQFDGTPILKALWRETKECLFVEADEDLPNKGVFCNLSKRLDGVDNKCGLCGALEENYIHVLVECPCATTIWVESGFDEGFFPTNFIDGSDWMSWALNNLDESTLCSVLIVAWAIWNNRNKSYFAKQDGNWCAVGRKALPWLTEYDEVKDNLLKTPQSAPGAVKWCPPMAGLWKFNVDAGHKADGGTGLGWCVCDYIGELVLMGYDYRSVWSSPEVDEARALYFGLKSAWECGFRRLMIESDCLGLVSKIRKKMVPNSVIGFIISDILGLASCFDFILFSHIRREGNGLAHQIVAFNFNDLHEYVWSEEFPDFALDGASLDMYLYLEDN